MYGFRRFYVGAVITMAVGASMRSLTFKLIQFVIDEVFTKGLYRDKLFLFALSFVGLALMEGVFSFLRGTWAARTAEGVTQRLRNYLYDHIQRLNFTFHDHAKTGELIQKVTSDVDALRRFYADQAIGIGRIAALFVVNMIMLLQMNWRLALLSVGIMPLVVVMSYFFFGRVSKAYEKYQEQDAVVSTRLQENLSGVRVVRAFARQRYEMDEFEKANWEKYRLGKRLLIMHSAYWPVSDILCAAQMLLVMVVGALMAIDGQITVGTYMAVNGLVIWIIWPMRNLGRMIVQVSTGLVSYRRVADVIAEEREDIVSGVVPPEARIEGRVEFEHLDFSYLPAPAEEKEADKKPKRKLRDWLKGNGHKHSEAEPKIVSEPIQVLHDITFRCEPGKTVALLGSTGSGKTSIINLLLRFYDYEQGSIRIDGHELNEYPRGWLRSQIGIVEQEPFLFSRSIRDNITYSVDRAVTEEEVVAAAQAAAIHDIILTFPKGYDTLVGEKGVTLSGGQRQRVAIARTLLKDPRILIFDDATSSVDTETEAHIQDALEVLMRGRTSFIIAHRIQSVMRADLILVLDKGRIVQQGTHEALIQRPGIYKRIYDLQARIEQEVQQEVEAA
ncbi:MAG: ABC transporter ATP-binding protein [Anaerolineae bacterium]|nr:ABC transporter ATP-binding protein [Anaerolineae bacterium]